MPYCPSCGGQVLDEAVVCVSCRQPLPRAAPAPQPAMGLLLPVNTSPWAIAAGYLGLFAFIVFPAPFALGAGLMAVRDLRRHPDRRGWVRTWLGLVVGGLGTALLLVVLVGALLGSS